MKTPSKGDYVIATKYSDGDTKDHWCVGWYKGSYDHFGQTRHLVIDEKGNLFRANGFRRCKVISIKRGNWIVKHMKKIEQSDLSVWHFFRAPWDIF